MKSESATDLPAPGSPPSSRLRSGRPIETGLPSSSTPRESGSHSEPVGTGPRRSGDRRAGRAKMIETWASEALAGSRTTRTSRAPMVAASGSAASSISSAVKPGGRRSRSRWPAGMSSVASTRGIWPRRLMTSQATSTRLNQRRVARSRSVVASQRRSAGRAPDDDAERSRGPGPPGPRRRGRRRCARGRTSPSAKSDLEPPPPDGECHPGVGAEGLDVLTLRHRAGAGDGRRSTTADHQEHDEAEVGQHEADQHQPHHHAPARSPTKRAIRPRPSGADRLDLRGRERHAGAVAPSSR